MFVAKVVGNVWATRKHHSLENCKLLLVQRIDAIKGELIANDEQVLAVDKFIDAGIGNIVLVMDEGNSARQILGNPTAPIRTIICGVIDSVTVNKKTVKYH